MKKRLAVLGVLVTCAALAAALTGGSAVASKSPSATARGLGGQSSTNSVQSFAPPAACNPCLYYSGDFNPNDADANALANEQDAIVSNSQIYTPVTPVMRGGRVAAIVSLHQLGRTRQWTEEEVARARETAERVGELL